MSDLPTAKAVEKLEAMQEDKVTARAAEIAPDMLRVQEKIARGHMLPGKQRAKPREMLNAASQIIDRAQGKVGIRPGEVAEGGGGITLHIHYPDNKTEKVVGGRSNLEAEDAIVFGGTEAAVQKTEKLQTERAGGVVITPGRGVRREAHQRAKEKAAALIKPKDS